VFVDSQPAQAQEGTEKLTFRVLEIAVAKVVPVPIALIWRERYLLISPKCFRSAMRPRIAFSAQANS
jgi:hypothetical protein